MNNIKVGHTEAENECQYSNNNIFLNLSNVCILFAIVYSFFRLYHLIEHITCTNVCC